ncbi:Acetylcholinesterase [Vespula maculifrons]|uniref:Acetylcholinesterase n=1 Tax=Vespula maculifrons TaxID=7453 RepID=A0ABD2CAZ0_VESMC
MLAKSKINVHRGSQFSNLSIEACIVLSYPSCWIEKLQYTDWEQLKDGYLYQKMIADVVGDYFFICPSIHFAQLFADRGMKVRKYHDFYMTERNQECHHSFFYIHIYMYVLMYINLLPYVYTDPSTYIHNSLLLFHTSKQNMIRIRMCKDIAAVELINTKFNILRSDSNVQTPDIKRKRTKVNGDTSVMFHYIFPLDTCSLDEAAIMDACDYERERNKKSFEECNLTFLLSHKTSSRNLIYTALAEVQIAFFSTSLAFLARIEKRAHEFVPEMTDKVAWYYAWNVEQEKY